jgi:Domain of unknown function (DUF4956)
MSDWLAEIVASGPPVSAREALVRLVGALVLGWIVAWVYRATRPESKVSGSFRATLLLLAILIAIVTQVIGSNTARAFSLVGALSIVRFRTVVQDTQDTAFVIFAVVMGMAAGAGDIWMSAIGLVIVSAAAFAMKSRQAGVPDSPGYSLSLRVGLGHDLAELVRAPFAAHVGRHRLLSMETARQGTAIEAAYEVRFRPDGSAEGLVKALNRLDGVQNVQLQDAGLDDD